MLSRLSACSRSRQCWSATRSNNAAHGSSWHSSELAKVPPLAKRGLAHDYIIMTNAGVSGEADASICKAFEAAGAKQCRVFGRDWIIAQLRERARLRMMVPRVYGVL
jgi:hypothetical protein